ncbi:MAG TPA: hypothetical protein VFR35_08095 [Actinoplanes sp.]|nr:hypothetical protein [Actinoplanes sp.]
MEPISLILGALLAGATKGVGDAAGTAIKDAYTGLRDALKRRLASKPAAQSAVEEYVDDPDEWRELLAKYLQQAGADRDPAIVDAAEIVMGEIDPDGARTGKYEVDVRGAQGVQVGDGNLQTNTFTSPPAGYRAP